MDACYSHGESNDGLEYVYFANDDESRSLMLLRNLKEIASDR